jgi:hypothetical protein
MRGNLAQLTIGGYLYEQPGIITGLNYTMDENTPWEIGIGTSYAGGGGTVQGDSKVKELSHIIKVSGFTFIPIHRFRPEIQSNQEDWKRYIALENGQNTNYTGGQIPKVVTVKNQSQIKTDPVLGTDTQLGSGLFIPKQKTPVSWESQVSSWNNQFLGNNSNLSQNSKIGLGFNPKPTFKPGSSNFGIGL